MEAKKLPKPQVDALIATVRLCIKAYRNEDLPGQYLYAAMEYLADRLQDLDCLVLTAAERETLRGQEARLSQAIDEEYAEGDEEERS